MLRYFIIVLIVLPLISFAHIGGHGEVAEIFAPVKWTDKQGQFLAEGSCVTFNNEYVFVETPSHQIVKISIAQLSHANADFVTKRKQWVANVNQFYSSTSPISTTNPNWWQHISLMNGLFIMLLGILFFAFLLRKYFYKNKQVAFTYLSILTISCIVIIACSKESSSNTLKESTSTVATLKEAFAAFTNVTTRSDANYFYVESNGIAPHQMMVGITKWISQVPVPHPYTGTNAWSIPLKTKYASDPVSISGSLQRGAIAIAANGIPIFNPINASGLVSKDIGELDNFGGHSGRGDDYHYHVAPLHLETTANKPIAYAFDGYPVYGSKEPNGDAMATLDDFHGHEYTDGSYHYHGTTTYPFLISKLKGTVTLEGTAPQNQITPQASAKPPRGGDPYPINGNHLLITDLKENSTKNGYTLSYTIGGKPGSVVYSWDANDLFTYIFNNVDGTTKTETWQRKSN